MWILNSYFTLIISLILHRLEVFSFLITNMHSSIPRKFEIEFRSIIFVPLGIYYYYFISHESFLLLFLSNLISEELFLEGLGIFLVYGDKHFLKEILNSQCHRRQYFSSSQLNSLCDNHVIHSFHKIIFFMVLFPCTVVLCTTQWYYYLDEYHISLAFILMGSL